MALLLSLESSTEICSVALHENGILLAVRIIETPRSAAAKLGVLINEVLKESDRSPKEIEGVVITSGPGSYTGLRIGVATAKGLCYALNVPLISVNTLELLANQFQKEKSKALSDGVLLCPMIDARRMEVYCALLDKELNYIEEVQAKIIDSTSFIDYLENQTIYFIGNGAEKCAKVIENTNAKFVVDQNPTALVLGEIGYQKFIKGYFEDTFSFEPFYLKDFLIKKPKSV
jgi:tRNA threonylcarbamoyladenosine biosynthesis protein TsaB